MSLLEPQPDKVKKTADLKKYYREYRIANKTVINASERTKYFKRKNKEVIEALKPIFGHQSGNVYKMTSVFKDILESEPQLKEHLIAYLTEIEDKNE